MTLTDYDKRTKTIAIASTALIVALVVLWLVVGHISLPELPPKWPPQHGKVELADEQFFEVVDIPMPYESAEAPSPVKSDVDANNLSNPAPASGTDLTNNGPVADAPQPATSSRPSPVKENPAPPKPVGPTQEEIDAQKAEEARRRADKDMASVFGNAKGGNNTANNGAKEGNSGSPTGTAVGINGTSTGNVGGGWIMPKYAKVEATVTGSIVFRVRIDKNGNVTDITYQGGNPPAATNPQLREAVKREIQQKRFSRTTYPAPDEATATITYIFR